MDGANIEKMENPAEETSIENNSISLEDLLETFEFNLGQLCDIKNEIKHAFTVGLENESGHYLYHPVKMLDTHLPGVPTGAEEGQYVALDLGGTNLRILFILMVKRKLILDSRLFEVPTSVQTGTCEELFDFIAEKIEEGFKKLKLQDREFKYMGFTFSFPCDQTSLHGGILIKWTKGYNVKGVEGKDVVALLLAACRKRGIKIGNLVLINDTTGTLLCGAYENPLSVIGVINGTGTNACYLESTSSIPRWSGPSKNEFVIINTEWGAFGEAGALDRYRTYIDIMLDLKSINPKKQIFEKMVSAMYLGVIVLFIIRIATEKHWIFDGILPDFLKEENSFPTAYMSYIYEKSKFKEIMRERGLELRDKDYEKLLKISDTILKRSAGLMAAGLAALIERINREKCVIAADGALFKANDQYLLYVNNYLKELVPDKEFLIMRVEDGSGKGAALAACIAENSLNPDV